MTVYASLGAAVVVRDAARTIVNVACNRDVRLMVWGDGQSQSSGYLTPEQARLVARRLFAAAATVEAGVAGVMAVRRCRVCGCTDNHACPGGCSWIDATWCSACVRVALPSDRGVMGEEASWRCE